MTAFNEARQTGERYTYGGVLHRAVQLVHLVRQAVVVVEGERQGLHLGPRFDAHAQLDNRHDSIRRLEAENGKCGLLTSLTLRPALVSDGPTPKPRLPAYLMSSTLSFHMPSASSSMYLAKPSRFSTSVSKWLACRFAMSL